MAPKNSKNVSRFLMILTIIVGVTISSLGIYFVSRQKNALALHLRNQTSIRLKKVLNRMEQNLVKEVKDLFSRHSLPVSRTPSRREIETFTQSILEKHAHMARFPFVVSPSGRLIYPQAMGSVLDLTERVNRDFLNTGDPTRLAVTSAPTVTGLALSMMKDEDLRQIFIQAVVQEFKHKNHREAQKLYKRGQVKTRNNRLKPFFLNGIARCYFKRGQVKQAIRLYQMIRNQYLGIMVKESEILLYRVFRQLALSFNIINDKGTAWVKYFSLYQRIYKTRDTADPLLVLFKNEALDFISRHPPPPFPVFLGDDFQELQKRIEQQPRTDLDQRLQKTYAQLGGIQWHRRMHVVPAEIEEIIARHNRAQNLYRALQAFPDWKRIRPSEGGVLGIDDETKERVFPIGYLKGPGGLVWGFLVNAEFFRKAIFNQTDKELAEEEGTRLLVGGEASAPEFPYPLLSLPMAPLFPEETLMLAANKKGYYQDRVRRDMWISYGLIGLLIGTFIVGIFLFYKYLSREAELVRLKSNFVDGVSHTLKTPLTRLSLLAEAVQEGCVEDGEKRERFFNTVISETMRMNEIINNMLNFSRVESGKKIYQPVPLLLQEVLHSILKHFAITVQTLGFTLEKDIDMDLPPVHLDREAAKLIILNLLQNAVKYSTREKFIRVSLSLADAGIQLVVEDRGLGIGPEHLPRVFDKFYRDTDQQIQALEGSGLGLYLVHHAVTAHQGEITVTSRRGEGSAFTVTFPARENNGG